MDYHVRLLRRQYLQLAEPSTLSFPTEPSTLHSLDFQSALYNTLFAPAAIPYPPPQRYTTRVLKRLIALLSSVPESTAGVEQEVPLISPSSGKKPKVSAADGVALCKTQEIHESLLELYTELLSRPSSSSPLDIGASGGYVTYVLPLLPCSGREIGQPVTLYESRNIISGQGTTGLRTWEAALALSEYLICTHLEWIYKNTTFAAAVEGSGRVLRETDSVLELGAGTGLVSVIAARLGASKVLATDGSLNVCETLLRNVKLNGVTDVVTVRQQWWGGEVNTDEKFDLVLGADVIYDASAVPLLISEFEGLFARNPGVRVIVSAGIRNKDTFAAFEDACRNSHFVLRERLWTPQSPSMFSYAIMNPIRIIHISKEVLD